MFNPVRLFLGKGVYSLGVGCHLHVCQNDRGFLCATAVTQGWNGHRIRVSTKSQLCSGKFSSRCIRESNPRSSDHKSAAQLTELAKPPYIKKGWSCHPLSVLCWTPTRYCYAWRSAGLFQERKERNSSFLLNSKHLFALHINTSPVQLRPLTDWVVGVHEGRFSRDALPVFSAGGPCEQFWHG